MASLIWGIRLIDCLHRQSMVLVERMVSVQFHCQSSQVLRCIPFLKLGCCFFLRKYVFFNNRLPGSSSTFSPITHGNDSHSSVPTSLPLLSNNPIVVDSLSSYVNNMSLTKLCSFYQLDRIMIDSS